MIKDLRIVPETEGDVEFSLLGSSEDSGLMLLQRLYVLLLSDLSSGYRGADSTSALATYLEGGNTPSTGILNAAVTMACSEALGALDTEDRELVDEFYGSAETVQDAAYISLTLRLTDGTTISGTIENG